MALKPPLMLITPGYAESGDAACLPAVRDLVRTLSATRSVTVVALRYPYHQNMYTLDGADVFPLNGGFVRCGERLSFLARACSRATSLVRQRGIKVVHALWADEPGYIAGVVRYRTKCATIVSVAGGEVAALAHRGFGVGLQRLGPLLVHSALTSADVVTCGSEWLARELRGQQPTVAPVVTPLGIDLERFNAEGRAADLGHGLNVVHVGSNVPVKAHDVLLLAWRNAYRQLAKQGLQTRLHLVGSGTDHLIDLPDSVVAHGEVAHAAVAPILRGADLWVQSSAYESQSVAVLEAAACGLPLLGTAVGLLADCPAALASVPAEDPQRLASAIVDALQSPPNRADAAARAKRWATESYGVERTTAAFISAYDRAVTQCVRPPS